MFLPSLCLALLCTSALLSSPAAAQTSNVGSVKVYFTITGTVDDTPEEIKARLLNLYSTQELDAGYPILSLSVDGDLVTDVPSSDDQRAEVIGFNYGFDPDVIT
jgi:hypothetical protein